jgi:hypothetical protein
MDAAAMADYIVSTFDDIEVLKADGNSFFYYSPEHVIPERTIAFLTIVTNDLYDQYSNLDRTDVYRLNIGVTKGTFDSLVRKDAVEDYTAIDRIMPHPMYAPQHYLCVLDPAQTLDQVKELLAEAYGIAIRQHQLRAAAKR